MRKRTESLCATRPCKRTPEAWHGPKMPSSVALVLVQSLIELVVYQPFWKYEFVSWDEIPIYGKMKNVPNHQPDINYMDIIIRYVLQWIMLVWTAWGASWIASQSSVEISKCTARLPKVAMGVKAVPHRWRFQSTKFSSFQWDLTDWTSNNYIYIHVYVTYVCMYVYIYIYVNAIYMIVKLIYDICWYMTRNTGTYGGCICKIPRVTMGSWGWKTQCLAIGASAKMAGCSLIASFYVGKRLYFPNDQKQLENHHPCL